LATRHYLDRIEAGGMRGKIVLRVAAGADERSA